MASDDPSYFSFIVRLVHLSMYTLVELSFGITQLLRTSAAIDTMLVPEVASRLRDDPLTQSLVHQVGVFHAFVGLIAYMLRDEILSGLVGSEMCIRDSQRTAQRACTLRDAPV